MLESFPFVPSENGDHVLSSFLMTDGGLTLATEEEVVDLGRNPYNSSLYRLAAAARKPRMHVHRYVSDRIGDEVRRKEKEKKKEAYKARATQMVQDDKQKAEEEDEQEEEEIRLFFKVCSTYILDTT